MAKKTNSKIHTDSSTKAKKETASTASQTTPQVDAESITKSSLSKWKQEAKYPIYAVIMCVGAAVGHTLGTYVFHDLMTWTSIGMGAGIIAALLYSRQVKKKVAETQLEEG